MAAPTVTYTFTNATAADATEVNQNFTDIIDAITDGTKDITVNLFQANGAATFNANVTLGNATGDDITLTGRVASDIDPKTAATSTLGDATQTWRALYLDNDTTDGGAIYFDAGSTEYIRSSADGATLEIGGFTALDFPGGEASTTTLGLVKKPTIVNGNDPAVAEASSGTWQNIDSISLTAGIWNVTCRYWADVNGVTITRHQCSFSATSGGSTGAAGNISGYDVIDGDGFVADGYSQAYLNIFITVVSTTTYYFNQRLSYTGSFVSANPCKAVARAVRIST